MLLSDEQALAHRLHKLESTLTPEMLSELGTWHFDVLAHSDEVLHKVVTYLFSKMHLLDEFKVSGTVPSVLRNVPSFEEP